MVLNYSSPVLLLQFPYMFLLQGGKQTILTASNQYVKSLFIFQNPPPHTVSMIKHGHDRNNSVCGIVESVKPKKHIKNRGSDFSSCECGWPLHCSKCLSQTLLQWWRAECVPSVPCCQSSSGPAAGCSEPLPCAITFTSFHKHSHLLYRGHIWCMWVGNNDKRLYNVWELPVLFECECMGALLCVAHGHMRGKFWLNAFSYTLSWGV